MSSVMNFFYGAANRVPSTGIEEDSTLLKAISCIPVVWPLFSFIQENSLAEQITRTGDPSRLIELINVKNQYKILRVATSLFITALLVSGIAPGIIGFVAFGLSAPIVSASPTWLYIVTALYIGAVGVEIYRINHNNQIVNELQTTGRRPGMQIR